MSLTFSPHTANQHMESPPRQEAYICRSTDDGQVVVFARCGKEIRIYEAGYTEEISKITLDEWAEFKRGYGDRRDIAEYNDVINAAWQRLALRRRFRREGAKALNLQLGCYFPRIWRGIFESEDAVCYNPIDARTVYRGSFIGSNVAISSIFDSVKKLFLYIEPSRENLPAFGHKIRETLILACTEVESSWRSVLEANGKRKDRYTTKDYHQLVEPLRLKDWKVELEDYPELGNFSPFDSWDESMPTQSLQWYDGYNAVKHHREGNFQDANLNSLINAAAALHVMQSAQFGPEIYDRFFGNERSPFFTTSAPAHDISDLYAPDLVGGSRMLPKFYW